MSVIVSAAIDDAVVAFVAFVAVVVVVAVVAVVLPYQFCFVLIQYCGCYVECHFMD